MAKPAKPQHPRKKQLAPRRRLYIKEWIDHLHLSDKLVGERLGTSDVTVYRWRTEQHRLDPDKQAALAEALGLKDAAALWYPPGRESIDAMLKDASDAQIAD